MVAHPDSMVNGPSQGMRERLFTMRMSEEEHERMERIAAHYGINAASLLRMMLKREEAALAERLADLVHRRSLAAAVLGEQASIPVPPAAFAQWAETRLGTAEKVAGKPAKRPRKSPKK